MQSSVVGTSTCWPMHGALQSKGLHNVHVPLFHGRTVKWRASPVIQARWIVVSQILGYVIGFMETSTKQPAGFSLCHWMRNCT